MAFMPAVALAADRSLAGGCAKAIQAQMAIFPPGPVLLNSFIVETGPDKSDFDLTQENAAYVYDNSLAGFALLAAGDLAAAARIGQALEIAQNHDRYWKDGRLRNAYQAGSMASPAKLPGWWDAPAKVWREDPYQAGSETGPVAWAMLLWAALGQIHAANWAADWLDDQLRASNGYYGGFYGFEPNPIKLTWQSTEQNTDLYAAFRNLGRLDDKDHAKAFIGKMLDPSKGLFNTGLTPDGHVNGLTAADAGIWPNLAEISAEVGSQSSALKAISLLRRASGIGFSSASRGIWLEGTAFAALALKDADPRLANIFMQTIQNNVSDMGYVYATAELQLTTGLTTGPALQPNVQEMPFNYYRRPALAPTAWAVLAGLEVNPLAR